MATQTNWAPQPARSPGEDTSAEERRADNAVIKDSGHPAHRGEQQIYHTARRLLCLLLSPAMDA